MSDVHWEDVAILADYGESSGGGPWIKLLMPLPDMFRWRNLKGSVYSVTACVVEEANGKYELNKEFVWRNDAQLLGFGETDTKGGWVKFRVEPEDLAFFRGRKDEYFYWKFILVEKIEKIVKKKAKAKKEKGEWGQEVRELHQSGFFRAPAVWKALGTDKDYQAWTRKQPCIITNSFDWDGEKGEERTEYAHVRRAGDAGTAYKPPFSGVPLVREMHKRQHNKGELEAYKAYKFGRGRGDTPLTEEIAKDWFNKKAMENIERWTHEALLNSINKMTSVVYMDPVDSLTKINPATLRAWAKSKGLSQYLPKCYKETE